jgi:hypothetical protein
MHREAGRWGPALADFNAAIAVLSDADMVGHTTTVLNTEFGLKNLRQPENYPAEPNLRTYDDVFTWLLLEQAITKSDMGDRLGARREMFRAMRSSTTLVKNAQKWGLPIPNIRR